MAWRPAEKTVNKTDTLTPIEIAEEPVPLTIIVLRTLWRDRRLLGKIFALGLILSIAIAFLIPNYYKSTVQLMPPGWQSTSRNLAAPFSGMSLAASSGAGLAGGLLNSRSPSGPLLGIIGSRIMQDDLIARFNLLHVYHKRYLVDARKILARKTDAIEDKPTGIISITVTDRDPVRARDMADAYVEELNKLVVTMDTSAAHRERVFLDQRLQNIQTDLESSEQQLSHFSSRTGAMNETEQSRAMLNAVTTVQGQLIAAESELHGLESAYSGENVRVKQAKARVATLNAQLQRIEGVDGTGDVSSTTNQSYPSLRQLPLLGVTYADLYRRTKTLEVAYELLNRELEAAKIEEAEEIPSVKVLDPPTIPQKKSFPPRILLIALGAVLSLFIAGIYVIFREVWRRIDDGDPWKTLVQEIAASRRLRRREA